MNRRGFFRALGILSASMVLDPEELLWVPGKKTIFIPLILTFDQISMATLQYMKDTLVFDDFFIESKFQQRLRSRGAWSWDGDTKLQTPFTYT